MQYKNHQNRPIDVVVYGSTGFVGKLIVEYFQTRYADADVSWAMAGRSREKLEKVRDEVGAGPETPLIVASADDDESLLEMAGKAKVVLSTVGPYTSYGEKLVRACVDSGTDYVDLCGEANFIRSMIDKYSSKAVSTGARIVFSCGFDSLPSDLGVQYVQEIAKKRHGKVCPVVRGRVLDFAGEFSGGTAESFKVPFALASEDDEVMDHLVNPFSLSPGFVGPEQSCDQTPVYEEDLSSWLGVFFMGSINRQNVLRTNQLTDFAYGKDFRYSEMMLTGDGDKGQAAAQALIEDDWIYSDEAPKPGEGPSREVRENGFYDILYRGTTSEGDVVSVTVKGDMDPGYGSTAKIIPEAALCLIEDAVETPGGIWTGGSAMGPLLRRRLEHKSGLSFVVDQETPIATGQSQSVR